MGLITKQAFEKLIGTLLCCPTLATGMCLATSQRVLADPPIVKPVTANTSVLRQGRQVQLNGRSFPAAWAQWQDQSAPVKIRTGVSDGGLVQGIGLELLNTSEVGQQPAQWFSPLTPLKARLSPSGQYRYLDISGLGQQSGWQMQAVGDVLQIATPPAQIQQIRLGQQPWGGRIVLDLDRPATWQVTRLTNSRDAIKGREIVVTVDAALATGLSSIKPKPGSAIQSLQLGSTAGRTTVKFKFSGNLRPQLSTLPNPNRLLIDVRPDPVASRDIQWAPGLRWQEQVVRVGSEYYPVLWLAVNPRQAGVKLQPIWSDAKTVVGTVPLATMAERWQAAAAINGGFFNRDKQLPLGAIRQNNRWISGPILNRGAIAWNEGEFKLGRLSLHETLSTASGQHLPVVWLNSGYVQPGIARYTQDWGATYTPLIDNEILAVVQNNQVVSQFPSGPAGKGVFPIPANGYLLVMRGPATSSLPVGTVLRSQITASPAEFNRFPQILGAGPVLVQNHQVVVDAKAEQFRPPFDSQRAPRSAIAQTADGTVLIVAVHNRVNGPGPSLVEMAQLMQQMGAVDALNLDGGSSTTLYLGGQLLDRHPSTAVRVHNGIGIFVQPNP